MFLWFPYQSVSLSFFMSPYFTPLPLVTSSFPSFPFKSWCHFPCMSCHLFESYQISAHVHIESLSHSLVLFILIPCPLMFFHFLIYSVDLIYNLIWACLKTEYGPQITILKGRWNWFSPSFSGNHRQPIFHPGCWLPGVSEFSHAERLLLIPVEHGVSRLRKQTHRGYAWSHRYLRQLSNIY